MKHYAAVLLLTLSACAQAIQQQSLLSTTLDQDSSPQASLVERYASVQPNNTQPKQTFFDNYQRPNSSAVSFETPSGLYRHLCTSCVYDTQLLQCMCQDKGDFDPVNTVMQVDDCQQITVDQQGQLMCLDYVKPQS
jgi:hypothetical protein